MASAFRIGGALCVEGSCGPWLFLESIRRSACELRLCRNGALLSKCPGPVDVWLEPGLMGRSLVRPGKVCVRQVQQLDL